MQKFTIEGYNAGKPVYLANGKKVTIQHIFDVKSNDIFTIQAIAEGENRSRWFSKDGECSDYELSHELRLGEKGFKKYLFRVIYLLLLLLHTVLFLPGLVLLGLTSLLIWPFRFIITGDMGLLDPIQTLFNLEDLIGYYFKV